MSFTPSPTTVSTNQQDFPVTRISPGCYPHSLYVSDGFESTKQEVFKTFPHQNPHFKPLENYPPSIRDAMKVALDLDFVHLAITFSQTDDPVKFFGSVEDYVSQLITLEDMGYDVEKLWERYHELMSVAVDEANNRKIREELEAKMKDLEVKAHFIRNRMTVLRKEMLELEANSKIQVEGTKNLESKIRMCTSKEEENFVNFRAAATKPW